MYNNQGGYNNNNNQGGYGGGYNQGGGGGYNQGGFGNNNNNNNNRQYNSGGGYNSNGYNGNNMNNNNGFNSNSGGGIEQDVQMNPDYQDTSRNIQQMQIAISTLTKLVQQLGTPKDSMEIRDKIRNCVESTTGLIHNSSNKVKNLSSLSKSTRDSRNKLLYDKLCREYNQCIQQFKEIATTASRKEKSTPLPTNNPNESQNPFNNNNNNRNNQAISNNSTFQGGYYDEQEDESQSLMESSRMQQLKQIESEREYQNSIIQERDEGIRKIEQSIVEINEIFLDLSNIVAEQGVMINTIEASLESTAMNTKEGVVHLQKASQHQRSSRTKMCWIALILLIVAAVLGIILFFTLRK
ncbi:hypothetical protein DICPUDRAFT_148991 [Dictyostelium purpureum]|uniref:t-SNARE coiled-coil homology domain-containing protein n=1 Tax=Dictyostelium purpureum TaxID=5786 RepID=F0ZCI9_DICPU|nr:uncharacterized protein DICPUDRAFT_148991 [Dictyostelium purpureum]EGC38378.1 hypothetical protein DICPUDRAFT_148991 [Dictyostelium purpureum]|eukprot:XP_003285135.1 hypothetical protein DICPUDRAFT_148991 [Dictyostelium purpureum]